MYFFDDFLEEDLALIVSLPYRVGAWISDADDLAATQRDDRMEERALLSVLQGISKEGKTSPFVSAVVEQTLTYRHMWDGWKKQETQLNADIRKAVRLMEARLPDENIKNYKEMLLQVAQVVAQAYGEFEGDEDQAEGDGLGCVVSRLLERFSPVLSNAPENVSAAESAAIEKLKEALKG